MHSEKEEKWTWWRPQDDEQEEIFKRMVMQKNDEETVKSLGTIQENMESSPEETPCFPEGQRQLQEKGAAEGYSG